jgi:hypothetical protein
MVGILLATSMLIGSCQCWLPASSGPVGQWAIRYDKMLLAFISSSHLVAGLMELVNMSNDSGSCTAISNGSGWVG